MSDAETTVQPEEVSIRPMGRGDWQASRRLLDSTGAGERSAAANIASAAALCPDGEHFDTNSSRSWLATTGDHVLGIICVTLEGQGVACVHDLVVERHDNDLCTALLLVSAALDDSKRLGCLKVRLDESVTSSALLVLLIDGGALLGDDPMRDDGSFTDFYLNLYRGHDVLPGRRRLAADSRRDKRFDRASSEVNQSPHSIASSRPPH